MSKLRSVNTHFWDDNYIIDLDPVEKLLFLYLLTNPNTNMLGIYEIHVRKISFDTGIDKDMVLKIFERFKAAGKAEYLEGHVCLYNFTRHQAYNKNMKISAMKSFNELPLIIREATFCIPLLKGLEPFPKGFEPMGKYELEYEYELEVEKEVESETPEAKKPTDSEILSYAQMRDMRPAEQIAENYSNLRGRDNFMRTDQNGNIVPIHDWRKDLSLLYSKGALGYGQKSNRHKHDFNQPL